MNTPNSRRGTYLFEEVSVPETEKQPQRRDRDGTRVVAAHTTHEVHRALRMLVAKNGKTMTEEQHKAWRLLFQANNWPVPLELEATLKKYKSQRYDPAPKINEDDA